MDRSSSRKAGQDRGSCILFVMLAVSQPSGSDVFWAAAKNLEGLREVYFSRIPKMGIEPAGEGAYDPG